MMKTAFLAGALMVGFAATFAPHGAFAQAASTTGTSTSATAAEAGGNPGTLPAKKRPVVKRRQTTAAATASPVNKTAEFKAPPNARTDAGAGIR